MTRTELHKELLALAASLDDSVTSFNAADKIMELGWQLHLEGFDGEG